MVQPSSSESFPVNEHLAVYLDGSLPEYTAVNLSENANRLAVIETGHLVRRVMAGRFLPEELQRIQPVEHFGYRPSTVSTGPIPLGVFNGRYTSGRLELTTGRVKHVLEGSRIVTRKSRWPTTGGILSVGASVTLGRPDDENEPVHIRATVATMRRQTENLPGLNNLRNDVRNQHVYEWAPAHFIRTVAESARAVRPYHGTPVS